MARKPRSEWSAAYRRRVEAAERKGKTGAARRGHRPAEHVERRRKSVEHTGLTPYQRSVVLKAAKATAARTGRDVDLIAGKLAAIAQAKGYDEFRRILDEGKRWRKERTANWRQKAIRLDQGARHWAEMEALADDLGIDDDDMWLLYYN